MKSMFKKRNYLLIVVFFMFFDTTAQHSVARQWNEILLEAIRNDYARPTVHARNLFHTSIATYDSWAVFTAGADTYFLGKEVANFNCSFDGISADQTKANIEEMMSYAAYRLLTHRFQNSPNAMETLAGFDALLLALGYDKNLTSTDYSDGSVAALGNHLAENIINFGMIDGSNEEGAYENLHYTTINEPLLPDLPGNPDISDVNRWQSLTLQFFIDQSGNLIPGNTPKFLSPEWGNVTPFSLTAEDKTVYERNGNLYSVYMDPGAPPLLNLDNMDASSEEYLWGFEMVSLWSSHLDPTDGVMLDISPGAIGNISSFPQSIGQYPSFYDDIEGGDTGTGHDLNPVTGQAYEQQVVPRGDYGRVLAEFWADGPDSETPPGHWFTLLNYVSDHPELVKKFKGEGAVIDDLQWDVKSYLILGGAMHDAAISAWGIKGWYDYIRPVSALRSMADRGQRSDDMLPNYDASGIRLIDGLIELVDQGDPLAGENEEHIDKIKVKAWKGPDYIDDPDVDEAGVDWILAENWWPYQRPSFVTPPFAGYISGHSTFSRAAAEVLTLLTGDPFFPGGMGEFVATKNEFLVFEEGPSVDVTLQWATYRDASDQCSLSRIWGGIHPPADDIPGRIIGERIGIRAFDLAEKYFNNLITATENNLSQQFSQIVIASNPVSDQMTLTRTTPIVGSLQVMLYDGQGKIFLTAKIPNGSQSYPIEVSHLPDGIYMVVVNNDTHRSLHKVIIQH
jgi:hypothetical protein